MNRTYLKNCLSEVLEPIGYVRSNNTWYKRELETILVVNLDKSPYGGQFYINLGLLLRCLSNLTNPPEQLCHFRCRIEEFFGETKLVQLLLNLEQSPFPPEVRCQMIKEIVTDATKWLDQLSTLSGLKAALMSDKRVANRSVVILRRHLGIDY